MQQISRLIFGFDIDGVLTADDDGKNNIWLQEASRYFGLPIQRPSFYLEEALGLDSGRVQEFFDSRIEAIYLTVPAREHCAAILQNIARQGHLIHLITARRGVHRQVTERWLQQSQIPYHSLQMHHGERPLSKGELCSRLGVGFFVDDHSENAQDVAGHGIYTLLYSASHNHDCGADLQRVNDWLEVKWHIERFSAGKLGELGSSGA